MGSTIEDEADDWWARLRAPDGENHRAAFEAWRSRDPRHAKAFEEAEANWKLLAGVQRSAAAKPAPRTMVFRPSFALAGIAGLLVIGAAVLTPAPQTERTGQPSAIAQAGPVLRAYRLGDGSTVLLDVNSRITVDLSGTERRIALTEGRARFIVAHDPAHPFIVIAAGQTVTARGTVFDVALSAKGARVVLINGIVDVASTIAVQTSTAPLRMKAGETVTAAKGSARVVPTIKSEQEWPAANLRFESIPLRRLILLANRHGRTNIRLADGVSGERTISGTFDIRGTEALARQLAAALDLTVSQDAEGILLSHKL